MFLWRKKTISRFFSERLLNYSLLSFIALCLLVFLSFKGFRALEQNLRPAILSIAEIKADMLATDAVNRAIMEEVARGILYQDLISIKQDDKGKIVMAQINTMEINRLMARTTIATQNALKEMGKEPIKIPLGEVLDSYLLAAYGPEIPVKLIPAGRVNTFLIDSFEAAGINQVRHKIYLDVFTEIRIVIPFISADVEVHTTVPIADTIYPGEVPETVINLIMGALKPAKPPDLAP
ncbi:MAG: sporulation protein YunB [Dethiobacter sp.]|jgi:sporulation protein YunB|nr:MAG: sporulation protein YunB [Dethiobacter sp.]